MSNDYLNIPEPNIDLNTSMGLIGKKDINDTSPQISYPLIILKNLRTSAVQEHIATILDNTNSNEGQEISFYGLNASNNLVYWRKGIASRKLRKVLIDYLIDFIILDKPKSQISFEDILNNNFDFIVDEIINDKPVINYEDLGKNNELNLEDKNMDKTKELLALINDLECKAKEDFNKTSVEDLTRLGNIETSTEEITPIKEVINLPTEESVVLKETLPLDDNLDLTNIEDLNLSLNDLGGVSFE